MGVYGGHVKTLNIEVDGMNCGGCVKKITGHFSENENVQEVEVYLENKLVKIIGEDKLSNMSVRNELIELGFTVNSIQKS